MARAYFVWLISAAVSLVTARTALPPSADAFYQAPPGLAHTRPGTILRSRAIPPPFGFEATAKSTYQLLFRSTDSQGRANAVVTTIFVPPNANTTKLFSVQNAYDSAAIDCAPSYQLYLPNSTVPERAVITAGLAQGWYVAVPDFEGFDAAFTNGVQSGQAVLDSVRAALQSTNITGLRSDARKVLAGGSGGALGSEWALELQPTYAPELIIDGTLLTALTPNVTSVLQTIDGTAASGLIPLGLLGLAKQNLNMSKWLSDNLVPATSAEFLNPTNECAPEFQQSFGLQRVDLKYFGRPGAYLDVVPQSVFKQVGIMGRRSTPKSPIFSYKGTADELSPVADTDALMRKYCECGAKIESQRAVGASHAVAGAYGFIAALPWIVDRLDGVPVGDGCKVTNVTVPAGFSI